jgi:transposase InsO family protein
MPCDASEQLGSGFTSDITYVWTDEGGLYLAVTPNLFNREVVGRSIKPRMTADLAADALTMERFINCHGRRRNHSDDRGARTLLEALYFAHSRDSSLPGKDPF